MSVICPTILATEAHGFRSQLERVETFAHRVHIDFGDGDFTTKSLDLDQAYWHGDLVVDLHVMYKKPADVIDKIVDMKPHMVIFHKESEADFFNIIEKLQSVGIDAGIALLQDTSVESAREEIYRANHVLIFSGHLGSFGGEADFDLLAKVADIRSINPSIEIGWDGGVNDKNVKEFFKAGIDVINVGGFIQKSESPQEAYAILESIVHGGQHG